jgi:hypothetical protein
MELQLTPLDVTSVFIYLRHQAFGRRQIKAKGNFDFHLVSDVLKFGCLNNTILERMKYRKGVLSLLLKFFYRFNVTGIWLQREYHF